MDPQTAVARLRAAGRKDQWIADKLGVSRVTVWRLGNGNRHPRYDLGARLVELARKVKP